MKFSDLKHTNNPVTHTFKKKNVLNDMVISNSKKKKVLPVSRVGNEAMTRSECGDISGWDNSSCDICEGPLSTSDTRPRKKQKPQALDSVQG